MLQFSKLKTSLIYIICFLGIYFSLPSILPKQNLENLFQFLPKTTVNLGLDLKGGSHLLLGVDFNAYLTEQLDQIKDTISGDLRKEQIGYSELKVIGRTISLKLRNSDNLKQLKKIVKTIDLDLEIQGDNNSFSIIFTPRTIEMLKNRIMDQSQEIIRRRVDENGTTEPSIQRQGDDYILLQVPGLESPEHLKKLLGTTAKLTFHLVNHDAMSSGTKIPPFGSKILDVNDASSGAQQYIIYSRPVLTGENLVESKLSFDEHNNPVVGFKFNTIGTKKFADITRQNKGRALAIVLDNKIISAPFIDEPIIGGSGIIRGNFTAQNANDLALLLRAGALPAPLKIIEERTVGPSLGLDSIESGIKAAIFGTAAVMLFMVLSYGIFGIFANIALIFNMFFIIAILGIMQATLTMPGIAGIVLTMGMAVDANVLIFERIREEIKNGVSPIATIERGFSQAFATILDSNLTTIIATLILYFFGSGAVKGFAVTLFIGILASMFSAITLTKYMIAIWYNKVRPQKIVI